MDTRHRFPENASTAIISTFDLWVARMKLAVVIILSLLLGGCDDSSLVTQAVVDETLPPVSEASRISVRNPASLEPFREITSPEMIERLLNFVNSYQSGWEVPWTGPPVGQVYFDFYDGDKFVGNFYVGPRFIGRDFDNFYSQSVTENEIAELSEIVGFRLFD